MPLATYTIKKSFFENHKEIDLIKLSEFNTDIEDFNLNQKAILIENANDNIKNKLGNIINELASNKLDNTLIQKKILLEDTLRNINQSLIHKVPKENRDIIFIDFEKNTNNQIPRDFKNHIIVGVFYPEDFENSCDRFREKFLDKLRLFLESKSKSKDDKIERIYIYHKELANYLIPDKKSLHCQDLTEYKDNLDAKKDFYTLDSIKKVEYGVNLLYKWWKNLSKSIKPSEFLILTDFPKPPALSKIEKKNITELELKFLESKIEDFLFYNNDENKIKAKIKIIKQVDIPSSQWWKHKRHWIFTKKINKDTNKEDINFVAVKSDFGVEIVNPNNNSKLSKEMELTTVTNKNTKHMRDITDYLFNDAKKGNI